jgi:hypothetical protein
LSDLRFSGLTNRMSKTKTKAELKPAPKQKPKQNPYASVLRL